MPVPRPSGLPSKTGPNPPRRERLSRRLRRIAPLPAGPRKTRGQKLPATPPHPSPVRTEDRSTERDSNDEELCLLTRRKEGLTRLESIPPFSFRPLSLISLPVTDVAIGRS
uniref:Uncharacterized protein n=1 Tax=Arthrobacter sp. Chr15 TaxID=447032 RepID=A6YFT1_9MICC|nr:unknown [Arthrobacter sp. Chr15]